MDKANRPTRHFAVFTDLNGIYRCHIVFDNFVDCITSGRMADLIDECPDLFVKGYVSRPYFVVDTVMFTDCTIFDIVMQPGSRISEHTTIEAVAAAEMTRICEILTKRYGEQTN